MRYCSSCSCLVNTQRVTIGIGIDEIWKENCEKCGNFIGSGFVHIEKLKQNKILKRKEKNVHGKSHQ